MAKVLKTVVVIAVAVAVVVFAPQIAAVLASVAGSLGVTVAATALSSALIGMGISMALAATATLFRKAPSMSQSLADRLNTSVVPTASRKIVFGTTAGGQDVRFFEGDVDLPNSKIDGYVQVIALASHRISAFRDFYVENDLVWSNGTFLKHRSGFAPNNPFRVVLEGKPGNGFSVGSGRYWNSTSTFTGCAYYVPFWKLDDKVWESGIPQRLTAIVDGCPVYDPRRDSTRGGSGPHRIDDQDTWGFRDGSVEYGRNPALALLTYLLGWRINGKVVWGMGIPAHRIDFDNFRAYANVCEERVATQGGGTVQRYHLDGIFSTTDSHETIINGITAAMGSCKMADRGGTYCLVGGYDDTAGPKIAFDADDLVAPSNGASPYIWNPAPPSRERFNIVRGRFANPDELYQLTDWGDPIEREPLADNIPRTLTLDLGGVSRPETCQRIAKQFLLREYLCPGKFSATFGPKAFAVEIGDVITLSLPSEGWNNKMFRVEEQAESHDMFFQMVLREEDPAIYAWDREEKPLPLSLRPQGYDASTTITPSNLQLSSASYPGSNGVNISEVHVSWMPEMSGRVGSIQVQSRPQGTTAWTEQAAAFDHTLGKFTFTANAPGITVEVQARFRMTSGVYSLWATASVATAAVAIIYDDVKDTPLSLGDINPTEGGKLGGIETGATVGGTIGGNIKLPGQAGPVTRDQIITNEGTSKNTLNVGSKTAADVVADLDFNADTMLEQIVRGDTFERLLAARTMLGSKPVNTAIEEYRKEFTDANKASAEKLSLLGSVSPDGQSLILNAESVKSGDGRLLATTLNTLEADSARYDASIENLQEVLLDPTGATARSVLKLDVNGYISGTVATNNGRESSFTVVTDQFKVVDPNGGAPATVFGYENGEVTIPNAAVGKLKVGAVDTESIGLFAIQKTYTIEASTNVAAPYNRGSKQMLSVAATKDTSDSEVEVEFFLRIRLGRYAGYFTIERSNASGTVVMDRIDYHAPELSNLNNYNSFRMPFSYKRRFNSIPAGTSTWRINLTHLSDNDSGDGGFLEAGTNLFVTEVKR